MIVNIPLATGNKLNCFISAREMFSNILPCALMLLFVFCFVDFYILNHFLEKMTAQITSLLTVQIAVQLIVQMSFNTYAS